MNSSLAHPKVIARKQLGQRLGALRQGKKVVFTNGCFDLLHPGHVDLLTRCKELGDILVMGVNSDASVQRLKGRTRPVNAQAHRQYVLAGLECVDFVTLFEEDTPHALISEIRPDVLVKGGDWSVDAIVGRDIVESDGGSVRSLPLLKGYSTTGIIERILDLNK